MLHDKRWIETERVNLNPDEEKLRLLSQIHVCTYCLSASHCRKVGMIEVGEKYWQEKWKIVAIYVNAVLNIYIII